MGLRQTSGVRVRNALATYRGVGAILSKERPIPPTLDDLMVIEESAKGKFFSAFLDNHQVIERRRDWPLFREDSPHSAVGCQRVPHPDALVCYGNPVRPG